MYLHILLLLNKYLVFFILFSKYIMMNICPGATKQRIILWTIYMILWWISDFWSLFHDIYPSSSIHFTTLLVAFSSFTLAIFFFFANMIHNARMLYCFVSQSLAHIPMRKSLKQKKNAIPVYLIRLKWSKIKNKSSMCV